MPSRTSQPSGVPGVSLLPFGLYCCCTLSISTASAATPRRCVRSATARCAICWAACGGTASVVTAARGGTGAGRVAGWAGVADGSITVAGGLVADGSGMADGAAVLVGGVPVADGSGVADGSMIVVGGADGADGCAVTVGVARSSNGWLPVAGAGIAPQPLNMMTPDVIAIRQRIHEKPEATVGISPYPFSFRALQ